MSARFAPRPALARILRRLPPPRPMANWPLGWIYAPSESAVMFALRNTVASLTALWIAFSLELSEPQWAAMTVWIVAQGSRGESVSKGRWRIVGTGAGMVAAIALTALFPQQPWLFLPSLAVWAGLCAALATLVRNFRSYAFVLAAYTCAIIAMDSSSHPQDVFYVAMDRGTYICVGVLCELVAGVLFSPDPARRAADNLREQLRLALQAATAAIVDILQGRSPPEDDVRAVFSRTLDLNEQIEFLAVEMGRRDQRIACAYETLGLLSRLMSRALGLRARLAAVPVRSALSETVMERVAGMLASIPERLSQPAAEPSIRDEVLAMATECAQVEHRSVVREVSAALSADPQAPATEAQDTALRDRIALQGVAYILNDYRLLLDYFGFAPPEGRVSGRYRLHLLPNFWSAFHNGTRTMAAIVIAGLVWNATAWPNGASYVSFVAVICGRFAAVENTVLASNRFLFGAAWAVLASIIPVFFLIPLGSGFGALVLAVGPFMFLGGLALRNPATASAAASYSMFFPDLCGLGNATRISDLAWFNTSVALLLGLASGVLVFKCVLPFDQFQVCMVMRRRILAGLRRILRDGRHARDDSLWVGMITQNMQRLIRYAGRKVTPAIDLYLRAALSLMTVGRNLIALRGLEPALPASARGAIEPVLKPFGRASERLGDLAHAVEVVRGTLRRIEAQEADEGRRAALTAAIGSLLIIETELVHNETFLDDRLFAEALRHAASEQLGA